MNIPSQYLPVMPYLILEKSKDFHEFMKNVFDAEDQLIVPGDDDRSVMHGELRIGNAVIMFAQAGETYPQQTSGMFIYVQNADNVFEKALKHGARQLMPMETKEYGYTGGFEDVAGNQWWIVQG